MASVPKDRVRAREVELRGAEGADEAHNIIARSLDRGLEALSWVLTLASDNKGLESKIEGLAEQLSGTWLLLTGQISEQRKGNRVIFTIEPKDQPKDQKPKNPKEASRPRSVAVDSHRIPARKVLGPMNIYYYDYLEDRASAEDKQALERSFTGANREIILYEILNLVDGKRNVQGIRDFISAAYRPIPVDDVAAYLRLLEKIGVVRIE